MSESGYTHTTLTGRPGVPIMVRTSFYLDDDAWIRLCGAGTDRAFVTIDHGDVGVNIGPRADVAITDRDVDLVRQLADACAGLLAEVERLHAEHPRQSDPAESDNAA
jgi:hypothetical protein